MRVEAIKTKDGYLVPAVGSLKGQRRKKIMLDIEVVSEEKTYKEMAAEAAFERYLEKQKREVPSRLNEEDLKRIDDEFGLHDVNSIDDLLKRVEG